MEKINKINLPSFLRRTLKAYALKAHIRQLGCDLSRIGRSRNWQLKANFDQIQSIIEYIEQKDEKSWLWLAKLLKKEYQHLSHDNLLVLATRLESVTITALMAQTDCTLAQARKVLDELEGLD
ncbi:ribosome recycling factor family protein [Colwellia psychrerythraea]|uniref:Ribosome recycling factor n=1 Tax=Colwellia psychrerythraea (strain 34H / ATCC BAA-681) TaxID=167879 RepID=Q486S4_COLP3|nr:ribosome recycling factor family protein [Colwellia psychrerythraea]AAZ24308.1 hypothetical protein CPS_1198 [Colwellia psychrerythraea 34H]